MLGLSVAEEVVEMPLDSVRAKDVSDDTQDDEPTDQEEDGIEEL